MPEVGIYQALNEVWAEVARVQKEDRVEMGSGGYAYASETSTIEALRPAMIKAGIVSHPLTVEVLSFDNYETSRGGRMNHCRVRVTYRIAHVSGSWIDVQMIGEGADTGDKAQNKAITCAQKYALWQTFLVARGDDPDAQGSDHQERATTPAAEPAVWETALRAVMFQERVTTAQIAAAVSGTEHTTPAAIRAWMLDTGLTDQEAIRKLVAVAGGLL